MSEVLKFTPKKSVALLASFILLSGACSDSGDAFEGGCEKFRVVAQNRWEPYGAAVRKEPDILAEKVEPSFAPNEVVAVDGWIEAEGAYPDNPDPWKGEIWFHLANREGWVNSAAVRGEPTEPDPTLHSPDGGKPAPMPANCEGTYNS